MSDPILEEIWRVREELIKKHGGIDGYFRYVQKLGQARERKKGGSKKSLRRAEASPRGSR